MAKDTRWDRNLSVAPDADGLVGHAGAVLLRKLADQCGLTSALGAALGREGKFPLIDRGMALVSMAVAIALGARSMSDIAVLAHQEPVLGAAPSDTTVRRTLELADARTLDKIARARAAVRAHVWQLICSSPGGFPWLAIAGKLLAGWLVIDLDATLITARSDKEGAASTFKMGYGFHPLGAWCANTAEITRLTSRAGRWPAGLRWIVRRTRPSRRQARNLTAFEKATGWRYSIIVTNIPAARGIPGVPGSHHAQFTDVLHRQHAVVEDGVRAAKSMGLRNLPSKTWVVNCGWVLAANLAADLVAWCRLLGLYDCDDLKDAEPGHAALPAAEPARPAGPPRPRP